MNERPAVRRVLAVTNMFRAPQDDAVETGVGAVIQQQVTSLRQLGLDVALLHVERVQLGMKAYVGLADRVRAKVGQFRPDVVHVMFEGRIARTGGPELAEHLEENGYVEFGVAEEAAAPAGS